MKKFFYSILAATTMLFATTSCSEDDPMAPEIGHDGKTQKVTFKVEMPGEATSRAIADGVEVGQANMANKLAWALYEVNKESGEPLDTGVAGKEADSKGFSVSIDMVKGLQYKVLFLAYNEDGTIFDVTTGDDLKSLNYKSTVVSNKEAYDAFVACHTHTVNDEAVTTVKLYRPFAQINAATTESDLTKAAKLGATVTASQLVIESVPTQYNVLTGEVSEYQDVTYTKDAILYQIDPTTKELTTNNEIIEVGGENYHYLNMVYVLAGEGTSTSSTHDAKFTFYRDAEPQLVRTIDIVNLPIQRNYRTNVIGDLITQTEAFKIVIDAEFDTPSFDENGSEVAAKTETVATVAELQDAINAANGPTIIKFEQDIVANSTRSAASITILQKVGTDLVIDGCGYKFDGTFYLEGGMQGGSSPETLTFKNINFNHTSADALDFISADDGKTVGKRYAHNVTVENCTFTGYPVANDAEEGVMGIRYRQTYNMVIKNSTFTNMYGAMWATGGDGIIIDNVTITNSKNGISLGTSNNVSIKNSDITTIVYGIRADGSDAYNLTVENTEINATQPIIVRKTTGAYSIALVGENILVTSEDYQVVFTNGADDAAYVEPTGDYSITGDEGLNVYPKVIVVDTEEELATAIQKKVAHIKLGNDITVNNDWDRRYKGTTTTPVIIDGQNFTIKFKGQVSDAGNFHCALRFENTAIVQNLTFDMSEVAGSGTWLRAISSKAELTIDNCSFIGSENYSKDNAVVVGDENSNAQLNYNATISNCTFINWRRGISDNENAKEVKSVVVENNTFTNAPAYISAFENIAFIDNLMNNSLVNITSYTSASTAKVKATGNTLDSEQVNVIGGSSKKFDSANVEAQEGFIVSFISE